MERIEQRNEKDTTQLHGNEKALHLRTGFDKIKEGLSNLLSKKAPEQHQGIKARVYEAIKNDFGTEIADHVFGKNPPLSPITVGDLRNFLASARGEEFKQYQSEMETLESALRSQHPLSKFVSSTDNLTEALDIWLKNQTDGSRLLMDGSRRHVSDDVPGIAKFVNEQLDFVSERMTNGGARETVPIISSHRITPEHETKHCFSSLAISNNELLTLREQRAVDQSKTNDEVMSENFAKLKATNSNLSKLQKVSSSMILGVQLPPRFEMLNNGLHKRIEELNAMKNNSNTPPEVFDKQQRMIENSAKEIISKVSEAIEKFESVAAAFQHPEMLKGLSDECAQRLKQFGKEYGETALALGKPEGPAQNLVAFAMLAASNPAAGYDLLHPGSALVHEG